MGSSLPLRNAIKLAYVSKKVNEQRNSLITEVLTPTSEKCATLTSALFEEMVEGIWSEKF